MPTLYLTPAALGYLSQLIPGAADHGLLRGPAGVAARQPSGAHGAADRLLRLHHPAAPALLPGRGVPADLTPRQWEILQRVAQGRTYKEIGVALHLSEEGVK